MEAEIAKPAENFSFNVDVDLLGHVDPQVIENRGGYAERERQKLVLDLVNRDPLDMNSFLKV